MVTWFKLFDKADQTRAEKITETGRSILKDMLKIGQIQKGDTVIAYRCDGCMAHDHKYLWIGTVTGFRENRLTSPSAVVKVLKRDDCRDSRDHDLGEEYPVAADSSLQEISPGLWFYYR